MTSKSKKKSVVLVSSGFVPRFEKQLVPFLKARGIFPNEGGDLLGWLYDSTSASLLSNF